MIVNFLLQFPWGWLRLQFPLLRELVTIQFAGSGILGKRMFWTAAPSNPQLKIMTFRELTELL